MFFCELKSRRFATPHNAGVAPADLQREPMGSAIWAAESNPDCRLPVTSRSYVGLPSRVILPGGYFFWQGHLPLPRISTTRDQVAPYLVTGRPLLWRIPLGLSLGTRPPRQTELASLFYLGSRKNLNHTRVVRARGNFDPRDLTCG